MKKTNTIYWILTGLFAGFMLFSAIPNIMVNEESVKFIGQLGYPKYFIPFIGVAKALGCIAIVIPGFARIKEWAYAGLFFDLIAAIYSLLMIGTPVLMCLPIALPIVIGAGSYLYHHKRLAANK